MEGIELRQLIETLTREVGLLDRLRCVLERQRDVLVKGNVEEIRENVENQIALLKEISDLEESRHALVCSRSGSGDDGKPVRLDSLIEGAPDKEAASLRALKSSLRDVLEALGTVNGQNDLLIRQSLAYIDKTLTMIAGEDTRSTVYTPDGDVKCPTGQLAVDRTI